jgi:SpoVK/Ycf46/Vps4 family AAA+-type ATPase
MANFEKNLELLIRARYPLVYLLTSEERRAEEAVRVVASKTGKRLYAWTYTRGFEPSVPNENSSGQRGTLTPDLEALTTLFRPGENAIFLLKDFHSYLNDNRVIRLLRDLVPRLHSSGRTILLLSPVLKLPPELEKEANVLEMPLPDREEIAAKLREIQLMTQDKPDVISELTPAEMEELVLAAQGLTLEEIENVCAKSIVEHRKMQVSSIMEEKQQIIRKSGVLEYYASQARMEDIGGLDMLKDWLRKRRASLTEKAHEFGLPEPKGVLLLGVQGGGKSLSAKAVATLWNLPMLRFDVGRVFGSLVGSSEANMRQAIRTAEAVAPCILWIDELEKAFAGVQSSGSSDAGTTARVFATFLTWLQEKKAAVFVVATANDVSQLPPELLRKGRFDEIFFIDLPTTPEREQIFAIHLRKRKRDPEKFDLKKLARTAEGFTGAEIEQVIVGALFTAYDAGRELTNEEVLQEIKNVVPISVMMREEIDELRTWAEMRARPASKPPSHKRNKQNTDD